MVLPLLVGRPASVVAVERGAAGEKLVFVTAQKDPQESEPEPEDLHEIGVAVRLLQVLRLPDNTVKVLVEGLCRAKITQIVRLEDYARTKIVLAETPAEKNSETRALTRSVFSRFQEYVRLNKRIPDEILAAIGSPDDARRVANIVSGHLLIPLHKRQALLAAAGVSEQLREISRVLTEELEILRLEKKIEGEVKNQVYKGQKEFYLQEQLKAIRKELGESASEDQDIEELRALIEKAGMPAVGAAQGDGGSCPPHADEPDVPGSDRRAHVRGDAGVPSVEEAHQGPARSRARSRDPRGGSRRSEKIKERILEYLVVVKLMKSPRGSILCLVGPPRVGKASLGRSIARAMGRKFVRVSLGGVRDEAEIRGHRRTYIGSMPGQIIQGIKRADSKNPVFLSR